MKGQKLLVVLFSVFVLTMATAVPVTAAGTGTTGVSGTVYGVIDVTAPSSVSLGSMLPGTFKTLAADMTVTVDCNVAGWSLGAADLRAEPISAGHMDNGDTALANPLEIVGGDQSTYTALSATDVLLEDGGDSVAGTTDIDDVNFRQPVEYGDPPGTYNIVVTFTGYTA